MMHDSIRKKFKWVQNHLGYVRLLFQPLLSWNLNTDQVFPMKSIQIGYKIHTRFWRLITKKSKVFH